ncbi:radical SAM protein [Chryseobacterium sp. MYb264]|uniref:radical SAM/SPASM domain-containing protein n=1 Tax=Chryseobacterium sp. MYb264 TaxID=2745153 RepID=UPI002E158CE6|nr:radical SAM protein [Chryseobacterium sp. MYb264]
MKYSQFNSIVYIDERYYLYNSFSQKFLIIDPILKDLLEASKNENIEDLEEIHPTFYNYLVAEDFIISREIDEVEKVKKIAKAVDENQSNFLLTINPTMNCNFKCWYCYETHVKTSKFSQSMIEKVGKFIEKTTLKPAMSYFQLAFFGGEPLLYFKKDVVPVIQKLQEECVKNSVDYSVSFTTNGYLIDDYFIDFFNSHKITPSFQITLDGYKEKHDEVRFVNAKKGSYHEIVKNIKRLINNLFFVRLRVNYTSENIADTYKIAEEFEDIPSDIKKRYLLMDFHRVWQDSQNDGINEIVEENTDRIKENGIQVKHMTPDNVRNSCYADKRNSAVINYNGDLFKCTARDFTTAKRAGYIDENGDLIWEDNYLERRMDVKFKNKPCLSCRLLPICNGGCSQHAMEAEEKQTEYCVYYGDDQLKDEVVVSKIKEVVEALVLDEV